jgi:hypothetical protein
MICQLHVPTVLLSENVTRYPLKRRQGGPYSHSGPFGEGKISSWVSTPDFSVSQRVVQPVYGLQYLGSLSFVRQHQQIPNTCTSIRACRVNNVSTNLLRNFLQRTTVGYLRYSCHTRIPPSLIAVTDRTKISDTERMASSLNTLAWVQRRF